MTLWSKAILPTLNTNFQMVTCERNKTSFLSYCYFWFLFHTTKIVYYLFHKPSEQKPHFLIFPKDFCYFTSLSHTQLE